MDCYLFPKIAFRLILLFFVPCVNNSPHPKVLCKSSNFLYWNTWYLLPQSTLHSPTNQPYYGHLKNNRSNFISLILHCHIHSPNTWYTHPFRNHFYPRWDTYGKPKAWESLWPFIQSRTYYSFHFQWTHQGVEQSTVQLVDVLDLICFPWYYFTFRTSIILACSFINQFTANCAVEPSTACSFNSNAQ